MFELRNVSHQFKDGSFGLKDISLNISAGGITLLGGMNGSGKTLLFKHLLGLLRPTSGEILWENRPLNRCLKDVRRRVGMIWQESELQIIGQTVHEEVSLTLRAQNSSENDERIGKSLEILGLNKEPGFPTSYLSGGEKRRLVMATMIAEGKEVLLMDEPFAGLDLPGVLAFLDALENLKRQGKTIILISHDLDKFLGLVDHVILLREGILVAEGGVPDIWEAFRSAGIHPPRAGSGGYADISWRTAE